MAAKRPGAGKGASAVAIGLAGLGALLLTLALALLFVVVPAQQKTPLDVDTTTVTDTAPGAVLVASALASNTPTEGNKAKPECTPDGARPLPASCFIDNQVPLYSQRHVTAVEPSDADSVTLQAAQSVIRADKAGTDGKDGLVSALIDRVTTDRQDAYPVADATSSLTLMPSGGAADNSAPAGFARDGLQYKFPFDTEQTDYPYFDASTFTTNPISFTSETTVGGVDVYEFQQKLGPIDMWKSIRQHFASTGSGNDKSVESVLASYRRSDAVAGQWGLPGDPGRKVDMHRYYTNTRTLYVNPETGKIVDGKEDIHQFFAESQADADGFFADKSRMDAERNAPTRTAFRFASGWNQETISKTAADAQDSEDSMTNLGRVLPAVLGLLGLVALVGGIVLGMRAGRGRADSAAVAADGPGRGAGDRGVGDRGVGRAKATDHSGGVRKKQPKPGRRRRR